MAGNTARLHHPTGCARADGANGRHDRPVYASRRCADCCVSPCTRSCKGLSRTEAGSALLESGQIPVAIRNPRELALIGPWFIYLAPTCTYRSSGIQYQHGCSGGPATSCFRMHRLFDPQPAPWSAQNSALLPLDRPPLTHRSDAPTGCAQSKLAGSLLG